MVSITLSAFLARYLAEVSPFLRSAYSVASVLRKFESALGARLVEELTPVDVAAYVRLRLDAGISPGTINRELSVISAAINYGRRRWGLAIENPVTGQRLRSSAPRLRYLSPDESARLIQAADRLRHDFGAFVRLALHTGCRKGELLTLRWADVDMQRRYFVLRPENTKSGRRRAVPLNDTALAALRSLEGGREWVFEHRTGRRIKTMNWLFRKAVVSAGIDDFRVHDMRHTFASWLVSNGVELVKVRDLLGHSSISMTERYAHLQPNRLLGAVQVLDLLPSSS